MRTRTNTRPTPVVLMLCLGMAGSMLMRSPALGAGLTPCTRVDEMAPASVQRIMILAMASPASGRPPTPA